MSLILAVSFYIWASLFVAGKHLMASSAKLRHRTKWKDPILLAVTVNQNKEQQYNSNNQQQKWNNINPKKHKQQQNKQLQNNWDFSQINNNNLPFMWWSLRTLKCVKCNFRCYGYRGCSFPALFSITPLTLIRHFHCIFELLSLSFCGLCTTSTIGGVINALHKLLLTFHCQSAQPICKAPLLKRCHLKSAERKPNTYFNCHRSQHLLVFRC